MYIDCGELNVRLNIIKQGKTFTQNENIYDAEYFYNHWLKAIFTISPRMISVRLNISNSQMTKVEQLDVHTDFIANVKTVYEWLKNNQIIVHEHSWEYGIAD